MKIELLKAKTVDGKRHAAGARLVVKKEDGLRMIEGGSAVEIIDAKKTQVRIIDEVTTATRKDFGPATFTNATERFL
ncbi:MAG: hypothetical protein M0R22_01110 [Dehalococcoidia bacterium]|jgi:hypothetical protein|nr:hypothetical protein [Dehalococcoidia bacterium]